MLTQINDTLLVIFSSIANFCWSNFMVYVMLFMGVFFTIRAGFPQIRHIKNAFIMFFCGWRRKTEVGKGELTPLQSVLMAIGGQIGIGNIVGPATAIISGGPGALFWIWVSAFFGMRLCPPRLTGRSCLTAPSSAALLCMCRRPSPTLPGSASSSASSRLGWSSWATAWPAP